MNLSKNHGKKTSVKGFRPTLMSNPVININYIDFNGYSTSCNVNISISYFGS